MLEQLRQRARALKRETVALSYAIGHPATPWYAKLFVAAVVAYAFSPIDLIPDVVPLLGYLDDLLLVPLGILVAVRLVPPAVMAECRARARKAAADGRPPSRVAAAVIVAIWVLAAALCARWALAALG